MDFNAISLQMPEGTHGRVLKGVEESLVVQELERCKTEIAVTP